MNEATRRRLARAEEAIFPPEPESFPEPRTTFELRTFENLAALKAHTAATEAANRRIRGDVTEIRVQIVGIAGRNGCTEPVGVRDLGELPATRIKRTSGGPITFPW